MTEGFPPKHKSADQNTEFSWESSLFYLGLFTKVGLCFYLFAGPLAELFLPHIENVLSTPSLNPWQSDSLRQFPYGSFLFFVLYGPCFLAFKLHSYFQIEAFSLTKFLGFVIQLILLISDYSIYIWGRKKIKLHPLRWTIFYWLNPVLIYISFVHGQLDVVSIALLLWSAQFLVEKKVLLSGLLMALALQSKFHVLLTLPLFAVYIWNQNFQTQAIKTLGRWLLMVASVFLVLSLPVWKAGESSLQYLMFSSPEAQRIFALQTQVGPHVFLWGLFALLLVMTRLIISTRLSSLGFLFSLGQALGALLFITNPSPGWFFWIWPFFAAFLSRYPKIPWLIPLGCVLAYFVHFLSLQNPGFFFWSLTSLQLTVFLYLLLQEFVALKKECPALGRGRPIFIGLAGDSGSGKDTLTRALVDVVGKEVSKVLPGDNYHRWERGAREWNHMTHLDPRANHLAALENDIEDLKQGKFVEIKEYDHHLGVFREPFLSQPMRYIFSQGLHSFFTPHLRKNTDLRIFLEPEESLRRKWKIERDLKERGHSPEKTLDRILQRVPDAERFFPEQKRSAHWQVKIKEKPDLPWPSAGSLTLEMIIEPQPQIMECLLNLEQARLGQVSWIAQGSSQKLFYTCSEMPKLSDLVQFVQRHFSSARPITRGRQAPALQEGYEGLIQIIFIAWLSSL